MAPIPDGEQSTDGRTPACPGPIDWIGRRCTSSKSDRFLAVARHVYRSALPITNKHDDRVVTTPKRGISLGLSVLLIRYFHHRGDRHARSRLRTPFHGLYQRRAALVVIVFDLTIQTLKAFRHDDLAGRLDRPHRT